MGEPVELERPRSEEREASVPATPVRLGIVGCGAVARAHLMAAERIGEADVTALVDTDGGRAAELAGEFGVGFTATDHRELADRVDSAIVAVPHHLHAEITTHLVRSGIHALVEKPMALSTGDCRGMIRAADDAGVHLVVGQLRRFFYSSQFVKRAVEAELVGRVRSFDAREGVVFSWPVKSDATFRREAGGGVLADMAVHSLDLLLWWFGEPATVEYQDDAMGGVEAECEIRLGMACGATGTVELSRTRDLRNSIILRGERGSIEVGSRFNSPIRLELDGEKTVLDGRARVEGQPVEDAVELFERQLANFVRTVRGVETPFVPGPEGARVVELIEACRAVRQPLRKPWMVPPPRAGEEG